MRMRAIVAVLLAAATSALSESAGAQTAPVSPASATAWDARLFNPKPATEI